MLDRRQNAVQPAGETKIGRCGNFTVLVPFGEKRVDLHVRNRSTPPLIGWPRAGEGGAGELLSIKAVGTDLRTVLQGRKSLFQIPKTSKGLKKRLH